jgi:hypothetical protein
MMTKENMAETLSDLKAAVERADVLSDRDDWPRAEGVLRAWIDITIIRLEVALEVGA